MTRIWTASACVAATLLAGQAIGQEPNGRAYMRKSLEAPLSSNEVLMDRAQFAELAEGSTHVFVFRVSPGETYTAYGACDDACSDIDLYARNAAGALLDSDEEDDEEPLVKIVPGQAANELRLTISLTDCAADACLVGVALFQSR
jgi:hypothetical protein